MVQFLKEQAPMRNVAQEIASLYRRMEVCPAGLLFSTRWNVAMEGKRLIKNGLILCLNITRHLRIKEFVLKDGGTIYLKQVSYSKLQLSYVGEN